MTRLILTFGDSDGSPDAGTGLGRRCTSVRCLPGHEKPNELRVFGYWEVGCLLDGLALCPAPAVAGLDEGPFTLEMHNDAARHQRYKQSRLSLTQLGEAILASTDDFSRHNPIHRWGGGTELTNAHLWRWDPANRLLIAP